MSECYADMAGGDCNCPMCKYTETPEAKDAIKVGKIVHGQHQEITRLRAENAELRKDAARYRWLRDNGIGAIKPIQMQMGSCATEADVDAAIDEAMGKGE